jgi:phage baseplate assembly protein gpV
MDALQEMVFRLTELERRVRNMVRHVEVVEDPVDGLVETVDKGGGDGKDLPMPPLPWAEVGSPRQGGNGTTWRPPKKGQKMVLFSPSGNLGEGILFPAAFSNDCAAPSNSADEHVETIGDVRTTMKNGSHKTEVGGASVEVTPGKITIECGEIVLKGNVHLGDEGGQLVHRKGDDDSDGDVAVGSASKVYAV